MQRRIDGALAQHGLRAGAQVDDPAEVVELDLDASAIILFACDVEKPREMAGLRRLRREVRRPAIVVISPPATGTGVRRALDGGADALVFDTELTVTLANAVRAVATGQSVVPRKVRASVERPVLSHREHEVLTLVRKGLTNAEIAERLYLAESTIKSHLASLFRKVGVRSRNEAAAALIDLERMKAATPTASTGDRSER
jgi:DNA-binding NarL/FixJ family response regulator